MSGQIYGNSHRFDRFFVYHMREFRRFISREVFVWLALALASGGCSDKTEVNEIQPYEGPFIEISNMETLYSDSAVVMVRVQAPKQLEFENGNSEFPDGFYIEFYEVDGSVSSTIEANKGFFNKEEKLYTATGDVEVKNIKERKKLNTEELHWKQDEEKIYTDKFVRIETADEILLGEGLTASQDFSNYKILKPTGELNIPQK